MKQRLNLIALLVAAVGMIPAAHARSSAHKRIEVTVNRKASEQVVSRMRNVLNKRYFSPELVLSDQMRDLAMSTHKLGFVKIDDKKLIVCRYDYIAGKISVTKFLRDSRTDMRAVKTEEFVHFADDTTQCVRKAKEGRSSTPVGEGVARIMRATTNPDDIKYLSLADLYVETIPTWVQADSAQSVKDLHDCLIEDLKDRMIDVRTVDQMAKPVMIFNVKKDLFLDSFDQPVDEDDEGSLWSSLTSTFNVTTFIDKTLRETFWDASRYLVDSKKIAKDGGVDLNPNLLEGIFKDIEKESGYFNVNMMIRQTIKGVFKKVLHWGLPALATVGLYYLVTNTYRYLNGSKLKEARHAAINAAALAEAKKHTESQESFDQAAYAKGFKLSWFGA